MKFHPLAVAVLLLLFTRPVIAQATFFEGFENLGTDTSQNGPTGLVQQGWIFRNQSQPLGATNWFAGMCYFCGTAQGGAGALSADLNATSNTGGVVSEWAVLPSIPNQRSGDQVTLYAQGIQTPGAPGARLQIWYSPSGGTGTGSGATDSGDFTQLLVDENPIAETWTRYSAAVPGAGRLALRYFVNHTSGTAIGGNTFLSVDTLSVGAPPLPPCNAPPIPGTGQTVFWRTSQSPYRVCGTFTIPAGGTVVVEPGVRVDVDADRQIILTGTMLVQGTSTAPVLLIADANFPPMIEVRGGTLQSTFTEFGGQLRPLAGGSLDLRDTTFAGPNGVIFSDLYSGVGFGRLERVTFNNSEFTISNYTLALDRITLNNSVARFNRDYPFISNLVSDGRSVDIDAAPQGTTIDTVTVRNVTSAVAGMSGSTGFGLGLSYGNFFIGPDVSLTNNTFPARIVSAGILPGSTLPATGNISNLVYVPGRDHAGNSVWADAGIPYFIADSYSQHGGSLRILEGARVKISPTAGMARDPSEIRVYGTEERPVIFDQAVSGRPWYPLQGFYRIRHAVLDGASTAAAWPSHVGWGFLDSSVVRNCTDTAITGAAIVRKTLFHNNATAAAVGFNGIDLDGSTNPSAFENNTVGVALADNAAGNWWNSPTGPSGPDNPGGTGDSKAADIPFIPFLTQRPDFSDAPPIVELEKHSFIAHPGNKLLLTWIARDDGAIVSQRIVMSTDGDVVQGNLLEPVSVLAESLPGNQRSFALTMPEPGVRIFGRANIRVEAIDNAGQVGWDDLRIYSERAEQGSLTLASPLPTSVIAGENLGSLCWQADGTSTTGGVIDGYLLLENSGDYLSLGGVTTALTCLASDFSAPFVSTDRARIVLSLFTGGGVAQPEYYYGPVFSVRPDARVGDAAPTLTLSSPAPDSSLPGGVFVAVRWAATDDHAVRAIDIQGSTDAGRTWSFIARNLLPSAGAYDWRLPPTDDAISFQVKVIAVDDRFQDTSAIVPFTIAPGQIDNCRADFNHQGGVTVQDIFDFLSAYFAGQPAADFNQVGGVTVQDVFDFLAAYFAGCS